VLGLGIADVDIPRGWIKVMGMGDKERRVPLDRMSPRWSKPTRSPGGLTPPAGRCSSWRRARTGASR
jgi:hypothetical protein